LSTRHYAAALVTMDRSPSTEAAGWEVTMT
jgi:hypothetical protein